MSTPFGYKDIEGQENLDSIPLGQNISQWSAVQILLMFIILYIDLNILK